MPDRKRLQPLIGQLARRLRKRLGPEAVSDMAIPSYTRGSVLSRWVFWRKLYWIERISAPRRGEWILDFGCGTGVLIPSWCLPQTRVFATDLRLSFARSLCRALAMESVEFFEPTQLGTIIEDETLDLVVAANVLEHVEQRVELLRTFGRKLKPGGRLVISGPSENGLYRFGRWLVGFSGDYHVANVTDVFNDARLAGFRTQRLKSWPLPGPACLYQMAVFERDE